MKILVLNGSPRLHGNTDLRFREAESWRLGRKMHMIFISLIDVNVYIIIISSTFIVNTGFLFLMYFPFPNKY